MYIIIYIYLSCSKQVEDSVGGSEGDSMTLVESGPIPSLPVVDFDVQHLL